MNNKLKPLLMFLLLSLSGILLFMVPVRYGDAGFFDAEGDFTITVKVIADGLMDLVGYPRVAILCAIILSISAVMSLAGLAKPAFLMNSPLLKDCFVCSLPWVIVRVLGCFFVWVTWIYGNDFCAVPTDSSVLQAISGPDQGLMTYDLINGLVFVFFIASYLLPLLTDFGLLEYVGALLTKFMRPVFNVPGRAAVDCVTSWIGDGTLGVMLTCKQYTDGYYSAREASIISTLFSAVSITFSLVVLNQVGLTSMFGVYYLLICFVGLVCAFLCPRIYPLRKKPDTYLVEGKAMPDTLPDGYSSSHSYGLALATKRSSSFEGIGTFLMSGTKNCLTMWFSILPTVMSIGTVALILAAYTPIFDWLGLPFYPLLNLLGVPEAMDAARTMVVGFTDMFTPAILIAGCADARTRFIVAVISVTQVLFLDEVGGLILSSKLPIKLPDLFLIFLERTVISILIVVPVSALLF